MSAPAAARLFDLLELLIAQPRIARVWAGVPAHRAHRTPGRHTHWRLARRRHLLLRAGTVVALLAVVGAGLLAGLSDDDPAGIATYSILGAKHGYELLWVLALSTAALIVFHELGVRLGSSPGRSTPRAPSPCATTAGRTTSASATHHKGR